MVVVVPAVVVTLVSVVRWVGGWAVVAAEDARQMGTLLYSPGLPASAVLLLLLLLLPPGARRRVGRLRDDGQAR